MSQQVYPTLPGLEWNVSRTIDAPPVQVRTTPSRREFRARDSSLVLYDYTLSYEYLRVAAAFAEWQTLCGFFEQMGGALDSFLFTDPDDNIATAQSIGTGNGATTLFQLARVLGGSSGPVLEPRWAQVSVSGTPINMLPGSSFEVDTNADGVADGLTLFVGGSGDGARTYIKNLTSAPASHGSFCQYIEITAVGNSEDSGLELLSVGVSAGVTYTVSMDARTASTNKMYVLMRWSDAASVIISDSQGPYIAALGYLTTNRVSFTAVAPAGAVTVIIYLRGIDAVGEYMVLDAAKVEQGAAATTYTDRAQTIGAAGAVTITPAPAAAAPVIWSGEFYRRCRFARSELEFVKFMQDFFQAKKVELKGLGPA